MEKRVLGTDLTVSALGLGCMGMTHASGAPADPVEMTKLIREAVDMGYTYFDTAECYTGVNPDGTTAYNESLVGPALKPCRDKVVLATKFGVHHAPDGKLILNSKPEGIRPALLGSLKKLDTDYVDLYYQHRMDPEVEPEAVAQVMNDLIKEGLIRHWGISEATEDYLRRAHAVCPVTAIQNRMHMMFRKYGAMFPVLEELHIGFVAFSPLANGLLSAAYNKDSVFEGAADYRSRMPQFKAEAFDENRELLELIRALASEKGATPAQISLAWLIGKKPYIVPIPGSRKLHRIRENAGAADIHLTPEEIAAIDARLDAMPMSAVFGGSGNAQK